jgi:hypothetical protein
MSKFEMVMTGLMAYAFVFHFVTIVVAAVGPVQHPATDWCRRVMFVTPTRRVLEIWQTWIIPVVYIAVAALLYHAGWQAAAFFTFLGAIACILRTALMSALPARTYRPKQLHPLCHWM